MPASHNCGDILCSGGAIMWMSLNPACHTVVGPGLSAAATRPNQARQRMTRFRAYSPKERTQTVMQSCLGAELSSECEVVPACTAAEADAEPLGACLIPSAGEQSAWYCPASTTLMAWRL